MDTKAFDKLSYGLYIVSTKEGSEAAGCVVNTLIQGTVEPAQLVVVVNNQNRTAQLMKKSGVFAAVALSQSATMELIGAFGFRCSKDCDKFAGFDTGVDQNGVPYVKEQVVARYSCRVVSSVDAGSHTVFIGEVLDAEVLGNQGPMTYAYYHQVKRGLTPPKASSYRPAPVKGYRCKLCGYVLESDTIPEDFVCPVCGRGREQLERIEEQEAAK